MNSFPIRTVNFVSIVVSPRMNIYSSQYATKHRRKRKQSAGLKYQQIQPANWLIPEANNTFPFVTIFFICANFFIFNGKNRQPLIMAKFKLKDKHVLFVNAIVGGMTARQAYIEHIAVNEKVTIHSASVTASRLMTRPEIKQLLERTRLAREEAITGEISRQVAKEFTGLVLTNDEMDAYNSAIVQGFVEVEEVVPQWTLDEILDGEGKVVKRTKRQTFVRVKRPANIRERQISMDILFKRFGSYAARKLFAAVGNVND